mmetsp:Transcript_136225/g.236862  ORF Transcript_136225/g.236862 Transcript_136225/m.236862 type:complete len:329 (+) Transcript_136225:78-1064(+)
MVASEEMSPEEALEEALKKTGPDLFKELYRLYPEAEVEDYYKNGMWKNEIMKTDVVLLTRHREEAGAKDPPSVKDIKVPGLPEEKKAWTPMATNSWNQTSPLVAKIPVAPGATAPAAAGGSVAELRLIALFVAKWKLDPSKTKGALAKLTPERRRFVVTNFKTDKTGPEATQQLEKYLEENAKDGKWDTGAAKAKTSIIPKAGNVIAPKTGGGVIAPKLGTGKIVPKLVGKAPGSTVGPPAWGGAKRPLATTTWGAAAATDGSASKWPKTAGPKAVPARPPSATGIRPTAPKAALSLGARPAVRPPAAKAVAKPANSWGGQKSWGSSW